MNDNDESSLFESTVIEDDTVDCGEAERCATNVMVQSGLIREDLDGRGGRDGRGGGGGGEGGAGGSGGRSEKKVREFQDDCNLLSGG